MKKLCPLEFFLWAPMVGHVKHVRPWGKRTKCPLDKMPPDKMSLGQNAPGQNAPHTGTKCPLSGFYNTFVCSVFPVKVCLFFMGMNKKTTFTPMGAFCPGGITSWIRAPTEKNSSEQLPTTPLVLRRSAMRKTRGRLPAARPPHC